MSSCRELDSWTQDLVLPAVVWLSGLFNPQSFLTGEVTVSDRTEKMYLMVCEPDVFTYILGVFFPSGTAKHRPQESVASGQDDSHRGCDKEDERRLWTPTAGGRLYLWTVHGRSE